MARIAGINIPMNKHVVIGLTHIFGVGRSRAKDICAATGIKPETKVKDLTEAEVNAIRSVLAKTAVEGDLRRENAMTHAAVGTEVHESSQGPAGPRTAHAHQCAH